MKRIAVLLALFCILKSVVSSQVLLEPPEGKVYRGTQTEPGCSSGAAINSCEGDHVCKCSSH